MEPSRIRLVPDSHSMPESVAVSSSELVAPVEHGSLSFLQGEPVRPPLSGVSGPAINPTGPHTGPSLSSAEQLAPQETQGHLPQQQFTETQQGRTTMLIRVLRFLGQGPAGTVYRKSLVRVIWNLSWGFLQVITVIIMLILVGTCLKSPKFPELSEWDACDRPLGLWASLWILRVILASSLAFWEFRRDRILHPRQQDVEHATTGVQVMGARINVGDVATPNPMSPGNQGGTRIDPQSLPHTHLYSRVTLLSSLITLSWFLTANILAYTSIDTCRRAAPHLWWLIFAILCIMYLMVLEVVVLGFVVLVVAPILFIFWNIFLICLGRHPMQNAGMIKPEIGKLSKAVVDNIPLVTYIPAPEEEGAKETPLQMPHVYPPKQQIERRRIRFRLLRVFFKPKLTKPVAADKQQEGKLNSLEPDSWVDNWEQGEYPFVTLEGNRAACAICLQDYEEPKRKVADNQAANEKKGKPSSDSGEGSSLSVNAQEPTNVTEDARNDNVKLADAGEAVQPLRLLGCGHVFHKTCVDPWLIDVSGRCPVCQRAVEPSKPYKSKRLP